MKDLITILTLRCRPLSSSKEVSSPRWLLSTWEFLARRFPTTLARCLSAVFLGRCGQLKHLDIMVIIPLFQTTPESVREYFSQFGDVAEVMVMKDPATRRSRGFGFITFTQASSVGKVNHLACFQVL